MVPGDTEQLASLMDMRDINGKGRELEVLNVLGNMCLEVLAKVPGMSLVIGSRELLSETSNNRLDHGETFTFGNNELD